MKGEVLDPPEKWLQKRVSLLSGVGLLLGVCLHLIRSDLQRNALLLFEVLHVDGCDRSVCLCVCMHVCV